MALTSRAFTMRPSPGQLTKAPHGRPAGLRGEAWGRSEKGQRGRVQTEIHPSFGNRREPAAAGTQGGRRELAGLGILGAFTQRQTTTLQQAVSRAGTPSSMRTPSTSSVRRPQHLCLLRHRSRTYGDHLGRCHPWRHTSSLSCNFQLSGGHVKGGRHPWN